MTAQVGDAVVSTIHAGDFVLQSFTQQGTHRFACLVRPVVAKRLRAGEQPRHRDLWLAPAETVSRKESDD